MKICKVIDLKLQEEGNSYQCTKSCLYGIDGFQGFDVPEIFSI